MKKFLFTFSILSVMALNSCNSSSIYGKYSFTMGRSGAGETRVGVSIELKKDKYIEEGTGKELGEKFTFELETDQLEKPFVVDGYFNIVESTKRVKINADITFENSSFTIPSELLQYVVVTYLGTNTFTLKMPVSMPINPLDPGDVDISRLFDNDLLHQLTWYGYLIDLDSPDLYWDLRKKDYKANGDYEPKHKLPRDVIDEKTKSIDIDKSIENCLGTHPSNEELIEMNSKFEDIFSKARFYRYNDASKKYDLIGSIVPESISTGSTYVFHTLNGYQPLLNDETKIECYINNDILGLVKVPVTLKIDKENHTIKSIEYDSTNLEINPKDYYEQFNCYEMRDYHEVVIDLKKE